MNVEIPTAVGGINLLTLVVAVAVIRNDISWIKSQLNEIRTKVYNGLSEELAEIRGAHQKAV